MTAFSFSDLRIKSMQIKGERPLIKIREETCGLMTWTTLNTR